MSAERLFESKPAAANAAPSKGTYEHSLFALNYDTGVAENVFARVAKLDLASKLKRAKPVMADEGSDLYPLRVAQQTVAFRLSTIPASPDSEDLKPAGNTLRDMVDQIAKSVLHQNNGKTLFMVGPLHVRVQSIGNDVFSFSLKQKWAAQDG